MIAHDDVGVNAPPESRRRLIQRPLKRRRRAALPKQIPAVVAAIDHVVAGACKFNPPRPSHPTLLPLPSVSVNPICQESSRDPFDRSFRPPAAVPEEPTVDPAIALFGPSYL